jgi:nicotinamidase-related amidase
MKEFFFLDVDTQRDLMTPSGALSIPGADRIVPKLRRLFDFARKHEVVILSSVDAHAPNDPEFSTLPPHCVIKTEGQRKIDETLLPRPLILENRPLDRNLIEAVRKNRQIIIEKQTLDPFSNPITVRLLRALPQRAIVFGVPFDLSVRLACLGLRKAGIKTAIVNEAVRALKPRADEDVTAELRKAGVEFIALETLLGIP